MIDDIRCKHLVQHSKVSAGNRFGKFSESREIFVLSHPHSSQVSVHLECSPTLPGPAIAIKSNNERSRLSETNAT
jgi:hypothetical protein